MKIIRPITITTAKLLSSNVAETDYAAYAAGTTYALANRVIYISGDSHWIVESLQNTNTGHTPTGLSTDTWWLLISNTNLWKMFDQAVNSQTSNADSISVSLLGSGRNDSVALLNVSAQTARVKMIDTHGATRTNLLTYSDQFDNAAWGKQTININVTPNTMLAPDGTVTADLVTDNETSSPGLIYQTIGSMPAGTQYNCSIYIKQGTASSSSFNCYASGDVETNSEITWTAGAPSLSIGTVTDVGGGWFRISIQVVTAVTGTFNFRLWPVSRSLADSVTGSIYLWGAQLEVGTVATDYIQTTSATASFIGDGIVYDQTVSLVSDSGINDWYAYFFEPIVRIQDKVIGSLPPYNNATINVTLADTGNTALCGACILGMSKELGSTQYGMSMGITDYSVKQQDAFGNYTILQRAFRRTADMSLFVPNTLIDQLEILLSSYRSTPNIYIGSDGYSSSIVYGFYKDFSINVNYVDYSICTISLEGIT